MAIDKHCSVGAIVAAMVYRVPVAIIDDVAHHVPDPGTRVCYSI